MAGNDEFPLKNIFLSHAYIDTYLSHETGCAIANHRDFTGPEATK